MRDRDWLRFAPEALPDDPAERWVAVLEHEATLQRRYRALEEYHGVLTHIVAHLEDPALRAEVAEALRQLTDGVTRGERVIARAACVTTLPGLTETGQRLAQVRALRAAMEADGGRNALSCATEHARICAVPPITNAAFRAKRGNA